MPLSLTNTETDQEKTTKMEEAQGTGVSVIGQGRVWVDVSS